MKTYIFGGTTEGGLLAEKLTEYGHSVTLFVATEYAEALLPQDRGYDVSAKCLDEMEMVRLLTEHPRDLVVDATHPYADEVTRNILGACKKTRTEYIRLLRSKNEKNPNVVYVDNASQAVDLLKRETGNVFLAIGSKELAAFTQLDDFASRCFVRILPMVESLQKTLELGFRNSNIICMHGPFDEETNLAMLSMTRSNILVTKNSGDIGGVRAKISAALQLGCRVIVIERPAEENGLSLEEIYDRFAISRHDEKKNEKGNFFFPLFFDMEDKRILVVGGGKVARRRIELLYRVGAKIRLVSPFVDEKLAKMFERNEIEHYCRKYKPGDVKDFEPFLTITATDDRETNIAVAKEARSLNVPCIVADRRKDCDCVFPAIIENENLLAGLISKDGNHENVRDTAERIRRFLNENKH